jgi:hypothetical protein
MAFIEQLSERAVLSFMVQDIFGLRHSDSIETANGGRFVSFAHATLVSRNRDAYEDSNNRDHDQKLDQRETFAAWRMR